MSVDDFGTGYSSLAYLKRLPDEVKLDKSFLLNMTGGADDAAIVRSTIELAHNLGLQLVAEGVEDQKRRWSCSPPSAAIWCRATIWPDRCRRRPGPPPAPLWAVHGPPSRLTRQHMP